MTILFVFICGLVLGSYLTFEYCKRPKHYNVTINLDAQDLVDVLEAEDEVDELKRKMNL